MVEGSRSNKDKILDAAEELFAMQAFDGTTTREITKRAGVPLGLMAYYFGTKSELYKEVILRRAPEHVTDIMASMTRAKEAASGAPLSPRELVVAFWQPIIEKALRRGDGWRHYVQLLVRVSTVPTGSEAFTVAFPDTYHVVSRALIQELQRMYPDANDDAAYWAFYVLTSAMNHMIFDNDRLNVVSEGLCNGQDLDTILDRVSALFEGGLEGLMYSSKVVEKARQAG